MYVRFGLKVDLLENQTNTFMHFIFNFYLKNLPLKPLKKFGNILEFTDVTNVASVTAVTVTRMVSAAGVESSSKGRHVMLPEILHKIS